MGPSTFPILRRRDRIALIGLSTARPTAPLLATGRLGRRQLQHLDSLLEITGIEGLFRVLLLHHSPISSGFSRRRRLNDAASLGAVIKRRGAELVLHGHAHRSIAGWLNSATVPIPVFGVPSASASTSTLKRRAGYNIYEIANRNAGWMLRVSERRWDPRQKCFTLHAQQELLLPPATKRHDAAGPARPESD